MFKQFENLKINTVWSGYNIRLFIVDTFVKPKIFWISKHESVLYDKHEMVLNLLQEN